MKNSPTPNAPFLLKIFVYQPETGLPCLAEAPNCRVLPIYHVADGRDRRADDRANFADDAATIADDRDAFADDAASFADDRANGADDRDQIADDTASFADGRATFAVIGNGSRTTRPESRMRGPGARTMRPFSRTTGNGLRLTRPGSRTK